MKVLIACEYSGRMRNAFRARGHEVWSCDLHELAEDGSPWHRMGDAVRIAYEGGWDLMVAHPPCTRLTNSGVRWLHAPPAGKTKAEMWEELEKAAEFYRKLRDAPIKRKAIENPVMHRYARERIQLGMRQVVQPWWFGEPEFKATGFELIGLPQTMLQAVQSLAVFGRAVWVGITDKPVALDSYHEVLGKEAEIIGSDDHLLSELHLLLEYARRGILDLSQVVTRTVPLDARAINAVLDNLEQYRADVRAVIVPES